MPSQPGDRSESTGRTTDAAPSPETFATTQYHGIAFAGPVGARACYGEYRVVDFIDQGGMGAVYRGVNERLGLPVAIKILRSGENDSAGEIQRLLTEARAVASLHSHPNIVKVIDCGEQDGQGYLVMQYVQGVDLRRSFDRFANDPRAAVSLMISVAGAVAHAHRTGILHLDLKPGNILLSDDGTPYVTDFGLARRVTPEAVAERTVAARPNRPESEPRPGLESGSSESGPPVGTPAYMPPEQAQGRVRDFSTLSDVYGLGATLFALICGREPHPGGTVAQVLDAVINGPVPDPRRANPRIDADLAAICMTAMARNPSDRYESAAALARDLDRWLRGKPVHARPLNRREKIVRWLRTEPLQVAAAALGVVALASLIGLAVEARREARQQRALVLKSQEEREAEKQKLRAEVAAAETLRDARETIHHLIDAFDQQVGNDPKHHDLRKSLLNVAIAYFSRIIQKENQQPHQTFDHLMELARAHGLMAGLNRKLGDSDQGAVEASFEAALNTFDRVASDDEFRDADRKLARRERGDQHHEYGIFLYEKARIDEARRQYEAGRVDRESLCEPCRKHGGERDGCEGDPEVRTQLGRSHGYLGDLYLFTNRLDEADRSYARSHAIRLKLRNEHPDDPVQAIQLGRSFGNLALMSRCRGHLGAAVEQLKQGLALLPPLLDREGLTAEARFDALEDLVTNHRQLAEYGLEGGDPKAALRALERGDAWIKPYVDMPVPTGRGGLGRSRVRQAASEAVRAMALVEIERPDEALASCELAVSILNDVDESKNKVIARRAAARAFAVRGRIARIRNETDRARQSLSNSQDLYAMLLASEDQNLDYQSEAADVLAELAALNGSSKDLEQALNKHELVVAKQSANRAFAARRDRVRALLQSRNNAAAR